MAKPRKPWRVASSMSKAINTTWVPAMTFTLN